jgi:sugar/nucleoside kinase (ribokinase family)
VNSSPAHSRGSGNSDTTAKFSGSPLSRRQSDKAALVLCAGIAVEDFLFQVERFPEPGAKVRAQALATMTGGCAANAAVAVVRLGGIARFAGPVGTDEASRRFLAALAGAGVETSGVTQVEGGSISVSGIFIDRDGEKMVATRHGERLDGAVPRDLEALLAGVDIVMADNRFPDFVRPICEAAHARGMPVVLDVDRATCPGDALFGVASHAIFSAEALRATAGAAELGSALVKVAAGMRGFVAATDGPSDLLWIDRGALRRMPVPAVEAVDTLAAGDVFHGAFALALAEGCDEMAAMRFAAAAAALKCRRFGGVAGAPRRAEVDALLAQSAHLK